jgi:hypothetical protein
MKRHVLSNGENNSVFKIQNISVNQEICGWKRLKHKIQNTSIQTICRSTRPSGTSLPQLEICNDGIRWMA